MKSTTELSVEILRVDVKVIRDDEIATRKNWFAKIIAENGWDIKYVAQFTRVFKFRVVESQIGTVMETYNEINKMEDIHHEAIHRESNWQTTVQWIKIE